MSGTSRMEQECPEEGREVHTNRECCDDEEVAFNIVLEKMIRRKGRDRTDSGNEVSCSSESSGLHEGGSLSGEK